MTSPDKDTQSQDQHLRFLERNAVRLSAVAEAGQEIGSLLELDDILQLLIDKAIEATGSDTGSIMLLDEQSSTLSLRVHRGIHPHHAVDMVRKVSEGISGWVARTGEPLHLVRAVNDERFRGVYSEDEIVDALCVPITYHKRVFGVISVNHHQGETCFTDEDMHVLVALGGFAAVAIQNARVYQELLEKRKLQEHLLEEIITAQEDERKRIAADIHDGPAQMLAGLQYRIDAIERLLVISPDRARVELLKLHDSVRKATLGLRQVLVELRPCLLDDLGLVAAVRQHLEGFRVHTGIHAVMDPPGKVMRLDSMTETVIYRVVQEALKNVEKHSKATEVKVRIALEGDTVVASVQDNGKGFDLTRLNDNQGPEHLGIVGMQERARMINGKLEVESSPGSGTTVMLKVPVTPVTPAGSILSIGMEENHGNGECACSG